MTNCMLNVNPGCGCGEGESSDEGRIAKAEILRVGDSRSRARFDPSADDMSFIAEDLGKWRSLHGHVALCSAEYIGKRAPSRP